jgi:hypothetical protein
MLNVMSKTIEVGDLPEPLIAAIESLVETYRQRVRCELSVPRGTPPIGWLQGQFEVPDSFFEPLPDDMHNDFNGGEEPQ